MKKAILIAVDMFLIFGVIFIYYVILPVFIGVVSTNMIADITPALASQKLGHLIALCCYLLIKRYLTIESVIEKEN